jgi:hypothetical protein
MQYNILRERERKREGVSVRRLWRMQGQPTRRDRLSKGIWALLWFIYIYRKQRLGVAKERI